VSLQPPFVFGRYPLMQWLGAAWVIASVISMLIGSAISFIPTHLVELVLIVLSLTIGIALLVQMIPSLDSPEWNKTELAKLSPSLRRPLLYFLLTVMFAVMSAANVYMVVLATHGVTSRNTEISLWVSYTGRDAGVLGRCSHYVVFRDVTYAFMRKTCIPPEDISIIHPGSRLLVSGTQSLMGFRPTSLRQCTPPLICERDNVRAGYGVMQGFRDVLLLVTIVCFAYVGWRLTPPNRRFHTYVLSPLGVIGLVIALLMVCRFLHVLCFRSN
jgi:hypothetical protein